MPKRVPYQCPRCNYQTEQKVHIRKHLYDLKRLCPATLLDLVLTPEIKEKILEGRVYHNPLQQTIINDQLPRPKTKSTINMIEFIQCMKQWIELLNQSKDSKSEPNDMNAKCVGCLLFPIDLNHQNRLCYYCGERYKKTKEMVVVNFLTAQKLDFIHNKGIGYVCGNYRPDILIDCNTHFLVVEVDEHQHQSYDINCEMARMNNIYIAQGLPTIFLRYNPDVIFHHDQEIEINVDDRLNYLLERIKYYQTWRNYETMIIERLFYDILDKDETFTNSKLIDFQIKL